MKQLLINILLITSFHIFGQNSTLKKEDFNHDGFEDTLESHYEGDSWFGGKYSSVKDGKTAKIYELNNFGSFNNIKKSVLIPSELLQEGNKEFLYTLKKELLPDFKVSPDPSLEWIMESTKSFKVITNLKYFDTIINPKINWRNTGIELPSTYYIELNNRTFNLLYNSNMDNYPKIHDLKSEGYLIYYGHNHFERKNESRIELITENDIYKVYTTKHGVLVKKENKYKWVFISDDDLFGNTDKLRFNSINKVILIGEYLVVVQNIVKSGIKFYYIDIESGMVGKYKGIYYELKENLKKEGENYISFEEEGLLINSDSKEKIIYYEEIFKELSMLN